MKVNLIYGDGDVLTGYLNLYPFAMQDTEELKVADVKNLDRFLAPAEADEIVAKDVVDYLISLEVAKVLKHWVSKLRHGGKIIIGGVNLPRVARALVDYEIDVQTANKLLHGDQSKPHLIKRVNLSLIGIADFLSKDCGLKIMKKREDGFTYLVEAQRP